MKNLILLISLLMVVACSKKNTSTNTDFQFPSCQYHKVVAYHFEDAGNSIISKTGELNPTVKKEQVLNPEQIKQILALLNNTDTYGGMSNRCFEPRLGVVFYDAQQKVNAHISICFQCNNFMATPQVALAANFPNQSAAFSEEGRRKLINFCKSLSFGQCGTLD